MPPLLIGDLGLLAGKADALDSANAAQKSYNGTLSIDARHKVGGLCLAQFRTR